MTDITARALAGIGNPLNDVAWVLSMLNLASRKAPQIGMIAGNKSMSETLRSTEATIAGANNEIELLRS